MDWKGERWPLISISLLDSLIGMAECWLLVFRALKADVSNPCCYIPLIDVCAFRSQMACFCAHCYRRSAHFDHWPIGCWGSAFTCLGLYAVDPGSMWKSWLEVAMMGSVYTVSGTPPNIGTSNKYVSLFLMICVYILCVEIVLFVMYENIFTCITGFGCFGEGGGGKSVKKKKKKK